MPSKNSISKETWDREAALYELGFKHANQIARELGVSPQTVSRNMQRRGVEKGSRVQESVQDVIDKLDRKARRSALQEISEGQHRQMVAEANTNAVGAMVAALLDAEKQGDLTSAVPVINRMGNALGIRRRD